MLVNSDPLLWLLLVFMGALLWCHSLGHHQICTVAVLHSHSGEIVVGILIKIFLVILRTPNYIIDILLYYTCLDHLNQPKTRPWASQKPANHVILLELPALAYW